jgi:hypothetical protein
MLMLCNALNLDTGFNSAVQYVPMQQRFVSYLLSVDKGEKNAIIR